METDTRVISYRTPEGEIAHSEDSQTGDGRAGYTGTIAAGVEQEIDIAFDKTKLKSFLLYSQQAAVTLRSNANHLGSPDDTVAVEAGQAFVWNINDPVSNVNPFNTANVTKFYVTNESGVVATDVKIRALLDVTP